MPTPGTPSVQPSGSVRTTGSGRPSDSCVTCGTPLAGRYCHACGERALNPRDTRLGAFLRDALAGVLDLDSRLWRSFRALVTRPGLLTAEHIRGRRRPYLGPLQVFLLANLLFFAVLTTIGGFNTFTTQLRYQVGQPVYGEVAERLVARRGAPASPERQAYARRFDESTEHYANSLVILMVPLFAVVLWLLHGCRRPFVHETVMALHFLAFTLLVMIALPLLIRAAGWVAPAAAVRMESDLVLSVILTAGLGLYLAAALRRGFGCGVGASLARGLVGAVAMVPVLTIYRMLLFFAVYFTLD